VLEEFEKLYEEELGHPFVKEGEGTFEEILLLSK